MGGTLKDSDTCKSLSSFREFDAESSCWLFYHCELPQLRCLSVYSQTPGQSTHEDALTHTDFQELPCAFEENHLHLEQRQTVNMQQHTEQSGHNSFYEELICLAGGCWHRGHGGQSTGRYLMPMVGEWHHQLNVHSAFCPNQDSVCFPGSCSHSHKTQESTTWQEKNRHVREHRKIHMHISAEPIEDPWNCTFPDTVVPAAWLDKQNRPGRFQTGSCSIWSQTDITTFYLFKVCCSLQTVFPCFSYAVRKKKFNRLKLKMQLIVFYVDWGSPIRTL